MKILPFTFALALCVGGLGCEMHPAPKQAENGDGKAPKVSTEFQKSLQPETANPNPPSFFPTPKPG
jgi:hypothetical protein